MLFHNLLRREMHNHASVGSSKMEAPRSLPFMLLLACALSCDALRVGGAVAVVQRRASTPVCGATAQPETKTRTKQKTSSGGGGGGKGGAPKLEVAKPKLKPLEADIPMWKVILLGDDEYEEDPVVAVLKQVIPEIENERQARERYTEAMKSGRSLLVVQPKEQAEFYVEQLARADPQMVVYSTIEEEK